MINNRKTCDNFLFLEIYINIYLKILLYIVIYYEILCVFNEVLCNLIKFTNNVINIYDKYFFQKQKLIFIILKIV